MIKNISLYLLITSIITACSPSEKKLFKRLDAGSTGIHFNNLITENDSVNILELEYVYNGGGVAIADFNNDSVPDIFFTGNLAGNQLYLNQGNMRFRDITATAQVNVPGRWNTGVAVVDINNDGWQDIYVCASIKTNAAHRANMLFVNQGLDKNGLPVFREEAMQYNIADTGSSTMAAFFDYDNDGDLDLYILTNHLQPKQNPNQYRPKIMDGKALSTDRLYRNDYDSALRHARFTDVSAPAGILIEGFGLGLNIADINRDGWKDIYVTNDYLSNDLLWINNKDGTFTNKAAEYFKHTSASAMGNDIADINNDGLADIIALDMLPEDNYRKKMMLSANNYQAYINNDAFHYEYQYARNTLQLNHGTPTGDSANAGRPVFSDIAYYAGIAETDWSWAPLVVDFDRDGYRDIIITNGFPKDVTDHDFMVFRATAGKIASRQQILEQIPAVKLHNYAFRNNGQLGFDDVSEHWGLGDPTFSSGAAYGDLDNDGDLDLVINNTNEEAAVYENTSYQPANKKNNFLQVRFQGSDNNRNGIGTFVELYYGQGEKQVYENTPYRGYLSTIQPVAYFGLGDMQQVDSMIITWPGGSMQVFTGIPVNQSITVDYRKASAVNEAATGMQRISPLFTDVTGALNVWVKHEETDFTDFSIQKLLPHKLSQYGPALAVADVDNNGLDDIFIGGSYGYSGKFLLQQPQGGFREKLLQPDANRQTKQQEDMGVLLFDADNDNDPDLYIVSGSYESKPGSANYQDRLYINNGSGEFYYDSLALPVNTTSKSCVKAADFDRDGDLDLFVGGRVVPGSYPMPVSGFILRNDGEPGKVRFTDITAEIAPGLKDIGLICDALWTDFNNDGWPDLLIAGEWMPLTVFQNGEGKFTNITAQSGLQNEKGWWNSLAAGDFDNDGDMDYIAGNTGQNTFYKATHQNPVTIYAGDFNADGSYDAFTTVFIPGPNGIKKEYPAMGRDDLLKQMISIRARFVDYKSFATATIDQVLTAEERKKALRLQVNNLQTAFIKNSGNGKFELIPLPAEAQLSCIYSILVQDVDADGNADVLLNGNDHGIEVGTGRYDALNGLCLKGDGKGHFTSLTPGESGIYIPGDGKALVAWRNADGHLLVAASQNRGYLTLFDSKKTGPCIPVQPTDAWAVIHYKNGTGRKEELYYGSSFLSQSARFIQVNEKVSSVEVYDYKGNKRMITIK